MRCATLVLTLAMAAPAAAADPLTATVTGRRDGKELTYEGGADTVVLGLSISVFGSAVLEYPATKDRWEAAGKTDHVRVRFARPVTLTAQTDPRGYRSDKRYEVDEILIKTTPHDRRPPVPIDSPNDWGKADAVLARCGDKYYSLVKTAGEFEAALISRFGPKPKVDE